MPEADKLRFNASQCRVLAVDAITAEAREVLSGMAADFEQEARALERAAAGRAPRRAFDWPLP